MKKILLGAMSALALTFSTGATKAMDEITVAYFPEWPMPFLYAKGKNFYEEALGAKVNFVSFDAGTAMTAAMASGDVQMAISMGVTPFLTAVSAGQDLQAVDVAVSYSDNDNCVVRESLEIDASNAKELEGKEVAVPLGTAAHTGFLAQMAHFDVDTTTMKLVDMAPVDSAAAFASGNLDMVCGWGGPLSRMREHGNTLLSGAEKEAVVGKVYDVTVVNGSWAAENPDLVTRFLHLNHKMNEEFNGGRADDMMPLIAEQAGMDMPMATSIATLGMAFPSTATQLSTEWLDGFMAANFKAATDKRAESGEITALDSYEGAVNASYLDAASKL